MDASSRSLALPVAATTIGFAVVQLDVTIVNVALPRIGGALQASVAALQWTVDAYTLSFAALLLAAGALSDRLGARTAYVGGFAIFALASAMCGVAPDAGSLIAARALQGVGAALLVPSSLALLTAACGTNAKLRARAVGLWTAAGVSIAAGPIAGGALLARFGWQSIFFVNVPICALAIMLTLWLLTPPAQQGTARGFDPGGQVLAIIAPAALVGTIIQASAHATAPAWILGGFLMALLAAIAFRAVEARAAAPMLPLPFFALPGFTRAILFGIVVNLTYYGIVFVLSLYLQQARGYAPLDAGLAYLPLTASFVVSNVASGAVAARCGTRLPMVAGALLGGFGFALLARLDATTPLLEMLVPFALIPFGMGLAVPAMTTMILSSVEGRFSGTASGALNAARQVGGALGVALFGGLIAHDRIISGLKDAAWTSAGLMVLAAVIAWTKVPRVAQPATANAKRIPSPSGNSMESVSADPMRITDHRVQCNRR